MSFLTIEGEIPSHVDVHFPNSLVHPRHETDRKYPFLSVDRKSLFASCLLTRLFPSGISVRSINPRYKKLYHRNPGVVALLHEYTHISNKKANRNAQFCEDINK